MANIIEKITGISEEKQFWLTVEFGQAYAERFYGTRDPKTLSEILALKTFWDWYRQEFRLVDRQFINCYGYGTMEEKKARLRWLEDHHQANLHMLADKSIALEITNKLWDDHASRQKQNVL